MLDGEPYMETIPMDVPAIADDNGVWKDYVLDFTDVPTADVFFIGFRFTSQRGTENAATYYVDDFSWGRTDVSLMKSAIDTAPHMAAVGETLQLEGLTVSGENLKGDISVSLSGADKGLFTLSTPTLPAQGGTVGLSFTADAPGQYGVMLVFSAEGTPCWKSPCLSSSPNLRESTARQASAAVSPASTSRAAVSRLRPGASSFRTARKSYAEPYGSTRPKHGCRVSQDSAPVCFKAAVTTL